MQHTLASRLSLFFLCAFMLGISACGGTPENPVSETVFPTATVVVVPRAGTTRTRATDGMTLVYVPRGRFPVGTSPTQRAVALTLCETYFGNCLEHWFVEEQPLHFVTIDDFWLDQTEVSNAQFAAFSAATGYEVTPPPGSDGNWQQPQGPGSDEAALADHPVVFVSWADAQAYCDWVGGRLPTEAEWEIAARGQEAFIFPWGDDFVGSRLNYCDRNCAEYWADDAFDDGYAMTAPVGSYPAGRSWVGAADMAGNVNEWVSDWFDDAYYAQSPAANASGPESGTVKVVRGGCWGDDPSLVRTTRRGYGAPEQGYREVGFRCVTAN